MDFIIYSVIGLINNHQNILIKVIKVDFLKIQINTLEMDFKFLSTAKLIFQQNHLTYFNFQK